MPKIITFLIGLVFLVLPLVLGSPISAAELLPPTFTEYEAQLAESNQAGAIQVSHPVNLETKVLAAQPPESARAFEVTQRVFVKPVTKPRLIKVLNQLPLNYRDTTDALANKMQILDTLQADLVSDQTTGQTAKIEKIKKLHNELKTLRTEVTDLRANLAGSPPISQVTGETDVLSSPENAAVVPQAADQNTEVIADLTQVDEELKYREALIEKLLAALEEENSDSPLEASLLAVTKYPVTSGAIVIFLLTIIWLLRGRIAELSGFGVRVVFAERKNGGEKRAGRRKTDKIL